MQSEIWVLLPQAACLAGPRRTRGPKAIPTLYLLHGLSDDHTIWMRWTSIERYAEEAGLAVVMPTTHRGFYTDMASGPRYWQHVSEDVPQAARGFFGLSDRRELNFVAGLSMGGYGAFKMALSHPERFAGGASLSGAMDARSRTVGRDKNWVAEMRRVFGPPARVSRSDNDLFHLAKKLAHSRKPKPRLYQCCGDKDFLLAENLAFRNHARTIGLDVLYDEDPGFGHTWDYWDVAIQRVIRWFTQPPRKPVKSLINQPLTQ